MTAPSVRVLISGAGIAGPCLAYWLTRTRLDVHVTIVERSPIPRVTGQSIDLRGTALEILKNMNLEEDLRARHTTEEGTAFVNPGGQTFAWFNTDNTFNADHEILRADLSQMFLDITKDLASVEYRYGDWVTSLYQTDKAVHVVFARGSSETFDLFVAADGAVSRTRAMVLDKDILEDSYRTLGQYIAVFSIPRQANDPNVWQWYNRPNGLCIMTRPHRNNATLGVYLCKTLPARGQGDPAFEEAIAAGTEDSKLLLHRCFVGSGWQAQRMLEEMDQANDFYIYRAAQVKLSKWTNGRALVIGDAAFATFGVGTSLAIESGYMLAGELSRMQSADDVPQALEGYEKLFRPIATKMDDLPSWFPQIAFPQTAWALWLRDVVLWGLSKTRLHGFLLGDVGVDWELPKYDWREPEIATL